MLKLLGMLPNNDIPDSPIEDKIQEDKKTT